LSAKQLNKPLVLKLLVLKPLALALLLGTCFSGEPGFAQNSKTASNAPNSYIGNFACAGCHAAIYNSYQRTPMAHASGPATEDLKPASFVHTRSGVRYQIYSADNKAWLRFDRPNDPEINGKRQLLDYIGSGRRGRSYLFAVDDFFFESPINWYADRNLWDMAPAYSQTHEIPLNLPAYASCLECHTSGMQLPAKGTENQYSTPLFSQAGVGCERCHWPGSAHAASPTKGAAIVNPAKLSAERRDSVCMQCHLEGDVAIERQGRHAYEFRPGDLLDNFVRHYVLSGPQNSGIGANSQFEALAQSACKKQSGDAMSCMSCHDPHSSPQVAERASYFRGKCLACHGVEFGSHHHPENIDCTGCHMPSSLSKDISHTEATDHRIQRRPETAPQLLQDLSVSKPALALKPFPFSKQAEDDIRDLALAWQAVAANGTPEAAREAARLLPLAAKQAPEDTAVLSAWAYLELTRGSIDHARELYRKILALDPDSIDAASNLGVIEAEAGHPDKAISLWRPAFLHTPGKSSIGMNLARTLCKSGEIKEAHATLERVLRFNPDLSEARTLLHELNAPPAKCGP
jgi:tetratricopeptide (TPR) repeat protein